MSRINTILLRFSLRREYLSLKAIPPGMKRIYSFLILAMICVLTSGGAVFIGLYEIHVNNERFCAVLTTSTSIAAVKPTDPAKQPLTEDTYQRYLRHLQLEKSLGC